MNELSHLNVGRYAISSLCWQRWPRPTRSRLPNVFPIYQVLHCSAIRNDADRGFFHSLRQFERRFLFSRYRRGTIHYTS